MIVILLISCYCFVRYGKKAYVHDESGASGRRIGSPNNYGMNLRHTRTGLDFSEDSEEAVIIWFTNICKNNSLVNWAALNVLAHKEPVHKSHLLMKPTTLGALRAHATIVHSLLKHVFLPLFCVTLSSPRLKSSTRNTAYIYILFCDNSGVAGGVAQLFLRVAVATPVDPPLC